VASVAVIGLGAMGSRIARRLLEAGHAVVVWNRTAARAEGFPHVAPTAADAARDAEVTITMLANPQALREVSSTIEPRALIEMSTVGPDAVHELADRLPDVPLLDAPVLGSRSEAQAGTLHVFVGGPQDLYERWQPLLAVLGTVHHVGPLGSGASAKLVANSTLFGTIGVLAEALRLAGRLGLSRDVAFEVLAASPIAAQAERRRAALEANDYPPRFPLELAHKDAELVTAADPSLRLAEAARSWLADADAASWGERDYSALLAWVLEIPES
jgi:3-hydroxyisobutyrate dehydrogenase-like beta-hydroxyacid dehydrogenase